MGWPRKARTLNEELLAELSTGPEELVAAPSDRQRAKTGLQRLIFSAAGALLLLGLTSVVHFLPSWVQLVAGALVVAHLVSIFLRSTRRGPVRVATGLRAAFLLWFAICAAATVLIAIGGFQEDDRALLGVVWPILALLWIAYRLREARLAAQSRPAQLS